MVRGLDALNSVSSKVVHKIDGFLENKIADAATKSNGDRIVKQEPVGEIIIPLEEKKWNIK